MTSLLDWWDSLGEVEKASRTNISELVRQAEGTIAFEQLAWMSTSRKKAEEADGGKGATVRASNNELRSMRSRVAPSPDEGEESSMP